MALSKVDYNSLNVTAAASKALKWNSGADGFETGDVAGALVLLETQTASGSSTISFTSDIDSTYKEYIFKFYDINPATDSAKFSFQADTGTNTSYNQTLTSTFFYVYHDEGDSDTVLEYNASYDLAQSTSFHNLSNIIGNGADESLAGTLTIYDPSNTTFVKHFISRCNMYQAGDYTFDIFTAGYFNITTAITRFQFKMHSGNFDGVIKLYGVT